MKYDVSNCIMSLFLVALAEERDQWITNLQLSGDSSEPLECRLCGKLISRRSNLYKHLARVHTALPAARCEVCGKWVKNKYAMRDHQRLRHSEQLF
jgi:DNA-directed RNA polymerase subunit N (RpoN/RPB10)